jgi:hypothetical protein
MGAGEKLRPQNLAGAGAERDGKCCVQVTPPNKSGCEWPRRARVRPVSKRRRRMHGRRRRGRKRGRRGGGRRRGTQGSGRGGFERRRASRRRGRISRIWGRGRRERGCGRRAHGLSGRGRRKRGCRGRGRCETRMSRARTSRDASVRRTTRAIAGAPLARACRPARERARAPQAQRLQARAQRSRTLAPRARLVRWATRTPAEAPAAWAWMARECGERNSRRRGGWS